MNKTEVIVETVKRVLEQGQPSISVAAAGACLYRGPNGTKCAIGMWIPDEKYNADFDNDINGSAIYEREDIVEILPDDVKALGIDFLSNMQSWHDSYNNDTKSEYVYDHTRLFLAENRCFTAFERKHGSLKKYVETHWKNH